MVAVRYNLIVEMVGVRAFFLKLILLQLYQLLRRFKVDITPDPVAITKANTEGKLELIVGKVQG